MKNEKNEMQNEKEEMKKRGRNNYNFNNSFKLHPQYYS